jgi:hypothetical protein
MKLRRGIGPGSGGTVKRWNGGTAGAASTNAHTAEPAVCGAARLTARHEHLLVTARHAGVMLYDSSLKHVSSSLVVAYYVEATARGSAIAWHSTGKCADDHAAWPDERVVSPMRQAVASTRRDRDATRSWRAASEQHRASFATHHRGHGTCGTITRMRPRRTRDRTQRTADQSGRTAIVHLSPRQPSTLFRQVYRCATDTAPTYSGPCSATTTVSFTAMHRAPRNRGSHRCNPPTGRVDHRSRICVHGPRTVRTAHRAHPSNALHRTTQRSSEQSSETASAYTLLHRASGELHPRTDDRAVARAQQAGESR